MILSSSVLGSGVFTAMAAVAYVYDDHILRSTEPAVPQRDHIRKMTNYLRPLFVLNLSYYCLVPYISLRMHHSV
jgi:hypothetical protein